MAQIIQVLGAIAILVAFALAQFHVVDVKSRLYLVLNFVGAAVLFVIALIEQQWGFVMLEIVWAVVSLWSLVQALRGRQPSSSGL